MTKILIEAKGKKTSEHHLLEAIIKLFFPGKEVDFICMNGIGNLFNETNLNQINLAQESGGQVVVLADADTIAKGQGYTKRKAEIENGMATHAVSFPYFLYPNNQDNGDVETLMESAARRDLHTVFFDCFEDYEKCVSGTKDKSGNPKYNVPDLKSKLNTYMRAQKLPRKYRDRFGAGDWLFDNADYWDLNVATLLPLREFLAMNLRQGNRNSEVVLDDLFVE